MDQLTNEWSVSPYSPGERASWDQFVDGSRNGTFLFKRDYMDYHRSRFEDASLMVYRHGSLEAVLPANQLSTTAIASHAGLTYGGLMMPLHARLSHVLMGWHAILAWLSANGITDVHYRRMPSFYDSLPDGDTSYAMFVLGAQLERMGPGVVVSQDARLPLSQRRVRGIRRARRAGLTIEEGGLEAFWREVLEPRLASRHQAKPVHTYEEIRELMDHFPNHIRQFVVTTAGRLLGGVTVYETTSVAKAQYIASNDEGRSSGALDLLVGWLLDERYRAKRYFDLGTCEDPLSRTVDDGLLGWKEEFGGRVYGNEAHRILTANHRRLLARPTDRRQGTAGA